MRPILLSAAVLLSACDDGGVITESRAPSAVEYGRDVARCDDGGSAVFALAPFTVWTAYKCDDGGDCLSTVGLWSTVDDSLTVSCAGAERVVLVWQTPAN